MQIAASRGTIRNPAATGLAEGASSKSRANGMGPLLDTLAQVLDEGARGGPAAG